jgi:hypothetical protein
MISSKIINNKKYSFLKIRRYIIEVKCNKFYQKVDKIINNYLYDGMLLLKLNRNKEIEVKQQIS